MLVESIRRLWTRLRRLFRSSPRRSNSETHKTLKPPPLLAVSSPDPSLLSELAARSEFPSVLDLLLSKRDRLVLSLLRLPPGSERDEAIVEARVYEDVWERLSSEREHAIKSRERG